MSSAPILDRLDSLESALERRRSRSSLAMAEAQSWLRGMFPAYVRADFAPHHLEALEWAQEVEIDSTPRPFIGIWPRGGGKSTLAELLIAMLGLQGKRRYCLYVSETQTQADTHVQSIATLFEAEKVEEHYPEHADRFIGKHGNVRGWRRDRIRTAGGFTVDALGLDVAARGVKIDETRPDIIILDDIDSETDTARTIQRKIDLVTRSILPAGTANCAVIGIQNLVHSPGVFARLADGRADFLSVRILSGPIPAVYDLKTQRRFDEDLGAYRDIITGGEPSWPAGQGLEDCQRIIDRVGLSAFLTECQHEVDEKAGALWNRRMLANCRIAEAPRNEDGTLALRRIAIGVDPSGGRAEVGIVAGGVGKNGKGYVLRDASIAGDRGPRAWAQAVVDLYHELRADVIVAEKNYGGEMVEYTIKTVDAGVNVKLVSASRGKAIRAEPVASLYGSDELEYEDTCVHHVGTFPELETELCGWTPGDDSPNRLDALVWALTELLLSEPAEKIIVGTTRPLRRFVPQHGHHRAELGRIVENYRQH